MTARDAARDALDALASLNARQERMGLPSIGETDLTWIDRGSEVCIRVLGAVAGGTTPDPDLTAAAAAHAIALHQATVEAATVQPASGSEA